MNDKLGIAAVAALLGAGLLTTKSFNKALRAETFMARGKQIKGQIPQRLSFAPFLKPSQMGPFLNWTGQYSDSEAQALQAQREEYRKVYFRELYAYLKDKIPSVSEDEFLWLGMNGKPQHYGNILDISIEMRQMLGIMMAGGSQFLHRHDILLLDQNMFANNIETYVDRFYPRGNRLPDSHTSQFTAVNNPNVQYKVKYETLKSLLSIQNRNMAKYAYNMEPFLGLKAWLVQNPDVVAYTFKGNRYNRNKKLKNPEFRFFDDVNDAEDYAGERNYRLDVRSHRAAEYESGQVISVESVDAFINAMVDRTPDNFWDGFAERIKMAYVRGNLTEEEAKVAQKEQDALFASRVLEVNKNPLTMKYTPNGLKSDLSNNDSRRVQTMRSEILRGKEIPTGPLFLVYDAIAWEIWAEEKAQYDETLSLLLKTAWTGHAFRNLD